MCCWSRYCIHSVVAFDLLISTFTLLGGYRLIRCCCWFTVMTRCLPTHRFYVHSFVDRYRCSPTHYAIYNIPTLHPTTSHHRTRICCSSRCPPLPAVTFTRFYVLPHYCTHTQIYLLRYVLVILFWVVVVRLLVTVIYTHCVYFAVFLTQRIHGALSLLIGCRWYSERCSDSYAILVLHDYVHSLTLYLFYSFIYFIHLLAYLHWHYYIIHCFLTGIIYSVVFLRYLPRRIVLYYIAVPFIYITFWFTFTNSTDLRYVRYILIVLPLPFARCSYDIYVTILHVVVTLHVTVTLPADVTTPPVDLRLLLRPHVTLFPVTTLFVTRFDLLLFGGALCSCWWWFTLVLILLYPVVVLPIPALLSIVVHCWVFCVCGVVFTVTTPHPTRDRFLYTRYAVVTLLIRYVVPRFTRLITREFVDPDVDCYVTVVVVPDPSTYSRWFTRYNHLTGSLRYHICYCDDLHRWYVLTLRYDLRWWVIPTIVTVLLIPTLLFIDSIRCVGWPIYSFTGGVRFVTIHVCLTTRLPPTTFIWSDLLTDLRIPRSDLFIALRCSFHFHHYTRYHFVVVLPYLYFISYYTIDVTYTFFPPPLRWLLRCWFSFIWILLTLFPGGGDYLSIPYRYRSPHSGDYGRVNSQFVTFLLLQLPFDVTIYRSRPFHSVYRWWRPCCSRLIPVCSLIRYWCIYSFRFTRSLLHKHTAPTSHLRYAPPHPPPPRTFYTHFAFTACATRIYTPFCATLPFLHARLCLNPHTCLPLYVPAGSTTARDLRYLITPARLDSRARIRWFHRAAPLWTVTALPTHATTHRSTRRSFGYCDPCTRSHLPLPFRLPRRSGLLFVRLDLFVIVWVARLHRLHYVLGLFTTYAYTPPHSFVLLPRSFCCVTPHATYGYARGCAFYIVTYVLAFLLIYIYTALFVGVGWYSYLRSLLIVTDSHTVIPGCCRCWLPPHHTVVLHFGVPRASTLRNIPTFGTHVPHTRFLLPIPGLHLLRLIYAFVALSCHTPHVCHYPARYRLIPLLHADFSALVVTHRWWMTIWSPLRCWLHYHPLSVVITTHGYVYTTAFTSPLHTIHFRTTDLRVCPAFCGWVTYVCLHVWTFPTAAHYCLLRTLPDLPSPPVTIYVTWFGRCTFTVRFIRLRTTPHVFHTIYYHHVLVLTFPIFVSRVPFLHYLLLPFATFIFSSFCGSLAPFWLVIYRYVTPTISHSAVRYPCPLRVRCCPVTYPNFEVQIWFTVHSASFCYLIPLEFDPTLHGVRCLFVTDSRVVAHHVALVLLICAFMTFLPLPTHTFVVIAFSRIYTPPTYTCVAGFAHPTTSHTEVRLRHSPTLFGPPVVIPACCLLFIHLRYRCRVCDGDSPRLFIWGVLVCWFLPLLHTTALRIRSLRTFVACVPHTRTFHHVCSRLPVYVPVILRLDLVTILSTHRIPIVITTIPIADVWLLLNSHTFPYDLVVFPISLLLLHLISSPRYSDCCWFVYICRWLLVIPSLPRTLIYSTLVFGAITVFVVTAILLRTLIYILQLRWLRLLHVDCYRWWPRCCWSRCCWWRGADCYTLIHIDWCYIHYIDSLVICWSPCVPFTLMLVYFARTAFGAIVVTILFLGTFYVDSRYDCSDLLILRYVVLRFPYVTPIYHRYRLTLFPGVDSGDPTLLPIPYLTLPITHDPFGISDFVTISLVNIPVYYGTVILTSFVVYFVYLCCCSVVDVVVDCCYVTGLICSRSVVVVIDLWFPTLLLNCYTVCPVAGIITVLRYVPGGGLFDYHVTTFTFTFGRCDRYTHPPRYTHTAGTDHTFPIWAFTHMVPSPLPRWWISAITTLRSLHTHLRILPFGGCLTGSSPVAITSPQEFCVRRSVVGDWWWFDSRFTLQRCSLPLTIVVVGIVVIVGTFTFGDYRYIWFPILRFLTNIRFHVTVVSILTLMFFHVVVPLHHYHTWRWLHSIHSVFDEFVVDPIYIADVVVQSPLLPIVVRYSVVPVDIIVPPSPFIPTFPIIVPVSLLPLPPHTICWWLLSDVHCWRSLICCSPVCWALLLLLVSIDCCWYCYSIWCWCYLLLIWLLFCWWWSHSTVTILLFSWHLILPFVVGICCCSVMIIRLIPRYSYITDWLLLLVIHIPGVHSYCCPLRLCHICWHFLFTFLLE